MFHRAAKPVFTKKIHKGEKRPLKQIVTTSVFEFFGEEEGSYNISYGEMESHLQRPKIVIAYCVAHHQLDLCLGLMKRAHTITGKSPKFDVKVKSHISAGLVDVDIVNNHQMMKVILNPLYQNESAMIGAGLCTEGQYRDGRIELIDCITKLLQVNVGKTLNTPKKTNKYSRKYTAADAEDPKLWPSRN
eukprot:15354214-Ditylum_brightwellii.AAC.1